MDSMLESRILARVTIDHIPIKDVARQYNVKLSAVKRIVLGPKQKPNKEGSISNSILKKETPTVISTHANILDELVNSQELIATPDNVVTEVNPDGTVIAPEVIVAKTSDKSKKNLTQEEKDKWRIAGVLAGISRKVNKLRREAEAKNEPFDEVKTREYLTSQANFEEVKQVIKKRTEKLIDRTIEYKSVITGSEEIKKAKKSLDKPKKFKRVEVDTKPIEPIIFNGRSLQPITPDKKAELVSKGVLPVKISLNELKNPSVSNLLKEKVTGHKTYVDSVSGVQLITIKKQDLIDIERELIALKNIITSTLELVRKNC